MDAALLDTDILSEVLKRRDALVIKNASNYLRSYGSFTFSIFTRFELARGLKEMKATRQLARFESFCRHLSVLPLTAFVFDRAADLWAMARQNGHPHGDADILIAATALERQLTLATGNQAHFAWVPGLKYVDWRQDLAGT
jgi:tRNA(fMet)-specific endonuclease VapC